MDLVLLRALLKGKPPGSGRVERLQSSRLTLWQDEDNPRQQVALGSVAQGVECTAACASSKI